MPRSRLDAAVGEEKVSHYRCMSRNRRNEHQMRLLMFSWLPGTVADDALSVRRQNGWRGWPGAWTMRSSSRGCCRSPLAAARHSGVAQHSRRSKSCTSGWCPSVGHHPDQHVCTVQCRTTEFAHVQQHICSLLATHAQ